MAIPQSGVGLPGLGVVRVDHVDHLSLGPYSNMFAVCAY